jgi:hypothetical protein
MAEWRENRQLTKQAHAKAVVEVDKAQKKIYRYYGHDFAVNELLVQGAHDVLQQGSCCLYKTTRAGVTTSLTMAAMEEEKQFLILSPTNNIFNTVNAASNGQNVRVAANSFCPKLSEDIKKDKFLAKLPLPLPEKCEECSQYGECEVTKIITSDMPVTEITYIKLEKIMLSESAVALTIRDILTKSQVILLDEAHTIALPQATTIPIGFTMNIPSGYKSLLKIMELYSGICNTYGEEILQLMQEGNKGHVGKHLSKSIIIQEPLSFKKLSEASNDLIKLAKARFEEGIREQDLEVLRDIIALCASYSAHISYTKKDDVGTVSIRSNTATNLRCLSEFLHVEGDNADHVFSSATLFYPEPKFYDNFSGKPLKQITFPDIRHNNREMIIKPDKWRLSARNFKKHFDRVINRILELYYEYNEKGVKVFILAPNTKKALTLRDAIQTKLGDGILIVVPSVDRERIKQAVKNGVPILAVDYYRDDTTMGVENDARCCIAVGCAEVPTNSYDHLARGGAIGTTDELVISSQALRLNSVHAATWQAWSRCKDPEGIVKSIVHCIGIKGDQVADVINWGEGRRLELDENKGQGGWKTHKLPDGVDGSSRQSRTPVFKVIVDKQLESPKMYTEPKASETATTDLEKTITSTRKEEKTVKDYIKHIIDFDPESITIPLVGSLGRKMPILLYRQNTTQDPNHNNRDRFTFELNNNTNDISMDELFKKSPPLLALFSNRQDIYARQDTSRDARGKHNWYPKTGWNGGVLPLYAHLIGAETIGFYQIYKNTVKWICFDVDDHTEEPAGSSSGAANVIHDVFSIFKVLDKYHIPFLFEASGSPNSYHIWIFLKTTALLNAFVFARQIAYEANFKGEVFPKQDYLAEKPDDDTKETTQTLGNLVKCPLGINRKTGVRSVFLNPDVYNTVTMTFEPLKGVIPMPKLVELREVSSDNIDGAGSAAALHRHRQTKRRMVQGTCGGVTTATWNGKELPLRPCMKGIVENHTSLDNVGGGHAMHVAIAIESTLGGMSLTDRVNLFRHQPDFDEEYTIGRLQEIGQNLGHKYSCEKLKNECKSLVEGYCKTCILNSDYVDSLCEEIGSNASATS